MAFCITKEKVLEFKKALRDGRIDPIKLAGMSSEARNAFLKNFVGDNATKVNALFESKLLLKNQKAGYISWAKKVGGVTKTARRDLISRIERMDKILNPTEEQAFLRDLAETRLGFGVTQQEAKTIAELSKMAQDLRIKAKEDGTFASKSERLDYGINEVKLEDYVNELKLQAKSLSFRENPVKKTLGAVGNIPGLMKSAVASFDNSFYGRQGIKTLLDIRTSHIWAKNFAKSFLDIGRELKGKDAMSIIKADIYSRPNALNGKYKAGGYGLDVLSEEAYPSHVLAKIPLLKRLYKASESAYNGGALRLRADLADRVIKIGEKNGLDMTNKAQAEGLGALVSSLTGRGSLGKGEVLAKELNVLLFSIKFLKGNIDILTAGLTNKEIRSNPVARKEAAKTLVSIVSSFAAINVVAGLIDANSVERDNRSTNFGKIKIFGHWTDISGGLTPLVVLASRLTPSYHNGELGFWAKSSTGNYTNLISGKYGQQTALDTFQNFWEGKLSPSAALVRDLWQGKTFSGEPVTLLGSLKQTFSPIILQNFEQLKKDPNSSFLLGSMILEGLGFSTSTFNPTQKNWNNNPNKTLRQFKNKIGDTKFKEANDKFNQQYDNWYTKRTQLPSFKNLSDENKQTVITKAKEIIQANILESYDFEYEKPEKDESETETIEELLP